jgi:hypothetical protein
LLTAANGLADTSAASGAGLTVKFKAEAANGLTLELGTYPDVPEKGCHGDEPVEKFDGVTC